MIAVVVLFVFAAATVAAALNLPIGTLRAPGSGFFPLLLGLTLAALAASQGVVLYRARLGQVRTQPDATVPAPPRRLTDGTRRVLTFTAAVAVALAVLPLLGYALTTLVLMAALLRVLGIVNWPLIGAVSAVTAIACHLVFVRILGIPLPSGLAGF